MLVIYQQSVPDVEDLLPQVQPHARRLILHALDVLQFLFDVARHREKVRRVALDAVEGDVVILLLLFEGL